MTTSFPALVARNDNGFSADFEQLTDADLGDGDVTVSVEYSTLNYKDGLAMTNAAPIVQQFPLILGVDYAGTVLESQSERFAVGDKVVRNSFGAGEHFHGGYSARTRSDAGHLIALPAPFTTRQAMAIGTAGYTAMLCVLALEENGVTPSSGEILVTGAAGGVGTVAVSVLGRLGYHVVASTGRLHEAEFLKALGAAEVIDRHTLGEPAKPMQTERWAGVVDSVGSHTLANAIAQTQYGGAVAACGLAQGADLPATVLPFILRNVRLQGIDSVLAPLERRATAWQRLASDLDVEMLESLSFDLPFAGLLDAAPQILAGQIRGRAIVDIGA